MHIRFYLLLILALSLAIPACKSTQNSTSKGATSNPDELDYATKRRIEALYVEACTYMIRGEYEKASEGFREVLKSDPVNHAAMYNIAKLGIEQRNFNEAIEYGKAALKLEKDNFWYYQMLSQAYEGKGDFENATLIQEQALERFPQRNEERLRLARLYARSQQYDEALRQLNTIEQQLGPNPETLAEKLRSSSVPIDRPRPSGSLSSSSPWTLKMSATWSCASRPSPPLAGRKKPFSLCATCWKAIPTMVLPCSTWPSTTKTREILKNLTSTFFRPSGSHRFW
jgi:tetratricopeptide (TPR) repeat protein